jgi:transcriptional regulator of arginine metabolism
MAARRGALRRLLLDGRVSSQEEIVVRLSRAGHRATQTTVSRDLAALGAVKVVDEDGVERYALRDEPTPAGGPDELTRMLRQFAVEIDASANLAVVKTLPGSAGPVATALDRARLDGILGTVAGDDTVLVVARDPRGGSPLARRLELLGGVTSKSTSSGARGRTR